MVCESSKKKFEALRYSLIIILIDKLGHAFHSETGASAALAGAMMQTIDGDDGIFTVEQMLSAVRPKTARHAPRPVLVSIENTANFGGGTIWPIKQLISVTQNAHKLGLKCHMDGARLFNAVIGSGTSAANYGSTVDSLWIDLSKGLGCPIGGVLAGDKSFIEAAFRFKHQFGGAMRQSGIIAAAGIYAIENNIERISEDHENAKLLAKKLTELPEIEIDDSKVETNLVFFDISKTGRTSWDLSKELLRHGVHIGAISKTIMRAVTHLNITTKMVHDAANCLATVLKK